MPCPSHQHADADADAEPEKKTQAVQYLDRIEADNTGGAHTWT